MDVEFLLNGEAVRCPPGLTVAGALFHLRRTSTLFCGMGVCCECVMRVDGRPSVRTCVTLVRAGMRVESQSDDVARLTAPVSEAS